MVFILGNYLHPMFPLEIRALSNVTVTLDFRQAHFFRGTGQWYYNGSPLYGSKRKLEVSKEGRYLYVLKDGFELLELHSTNIGEFISLMYV